MNFTQAQLDNIAGHFQAAKGLMPYRRIIENIANNRDCFKGIMEITYAEAINCNPELLEVSKEQYELLQELVQVFTGDPVAPAAYLAMMDIMGEYNFITSQYPDVMPIFIPKQEKGVLS